MMPRTAAGRRYPYATTAARQHDHTYCPVAARIAERAEAGEEDWGVPHTLTLPPDTTEDKARRIRRGIFLGRDCARNTARWKGGLSVSVMWQLEDGREVNGDPVRSAGGYVLIVRVWTRAAGKAKKARDVADGKPLDYNVLRS